MYTFYLSVNNIFLGSLVIHRPERDNRNKTQHSCTQTAIVRNTFDISVEQNLF